jgi:hypothetical protein
MFVVKRMILAKDPLFSSLVQTFKLAKLWGHQASELALKYRTITYDWRGTG